MEEEDMELDEGDNMMGQVYQVVEVDFEYEFDAARFFDFSRPESDAEARLSELWFQSAPNYPPSPFVAKLLQTEGLYSQYDDSELIVYDDYDLNQQGQYYDHAEAYQAEKKTPSLRSLKGGTFQGSQNQAGSLFGGQSMGLSFFNHLANDTKKAKPKSLAKPFMPRSSTLLKPTASQLAKQNQRKQALNVRSKTCEANSNSQIATEKQASKRQKLDGGLLHKIVDTKQPTTLIHKMPKKDVVMQGTNLQSKLRITIPREPDLETAHRAERIRSTANKEVEKPTSTTGRFKARPLNKKILGASACAVPKRSTPHLQDFQVRYPSQSLDTERTKQLATTATATSLCQTEKGLNKVNPPIIPETVNKDGRRNLNFHVDSTLYMSDTVDAPKLAERQLAHSFKARPLDRKILTSRGDLGVFRNSKRDVTVPKEFEFQTAKRNHQHPPVDLFSKLSLAGEPQPKSCAQLQLPGRTCISSKGSKENRWESCEQGQNMKPQHREIHDIGREKQSLNVANARIGEIGVGNPMRRTGAMWRQ